MKNLILAVLLLSSVSSLGWAAEGTSSSQVSDRMTNKVGIYLGVGDPAPTLLGVNVAYNVFDFMRATAGFGQLTTTSGIDLTTGNTTQASSTTIGFGSRFFVPGWSLSPTAGLHFASVSYSGNGSVTVGGFQRSGSHVYGSLGVDYQAKSGFNASAGMTMSFASGVGTAFYVNAGWFFDWLS
ncbi:hypothetical protein K2X30_01330 [bacterium]|jgi:hypothetical protein|nr:hypothetical protein [bacterium]